MQQCRNSAANLGGAKSGAELNAAKASPELKASCNDARTYQPPLTILITVTSFKF